MAFAPQLHPAHGLRSPEVIAVAVFTQPPVLAGCLACLLATRLGTIPLSVGGPRIRNKKLAATAAFTPGLRAAHGEPNLRRIRRRRKQKRRSPRKSRPKKEEQILDRSDRRKRLGRKWIFKPPAFPSFIPPLTKSRAVSNRNCVAAMRGGEQRNENDQSVTQAAPEGQPT
jgi:hypothetical protein